MVVDFFCKIIFGWRTFIIKVKYKIGLSFQKEDNKQTYFILPCSLDISGLDDIESKNLLNAANNNVFVFF